ncbi:MAG: AAA family ATPase [Janthinobacterium lividum]
MSIDSVSGAVSQDNSVDDLFDASGVVQMQFDRYQGKPGNKLIVKDLVTKGRLAIVPFRLQGGERKPNWSWSSEQVGGYEGDLTTLDPDDFDGPLVSSDIQRGFGQPMGIYVLTGERSGDLEVVDFDHESADHIRRFKADVGDLFAKLVIVSTAKGFHVYYRCLTIEGSQVWAWREPNADGKDTILIETRGCVGLVQCAGSPAALHPSGREYRVVQGSLLDVQRITPAERALIKSTCRSYSRYTPPPKPPKATYTSKFEGGDPGDDRPGSIFNRTADWNDDVLEPAGYTQATERTWWRPGKSSGSTSVKLVPSDDVDLLTVFSTSVEGGLHPGDTYTKFGAYVRLHHGGDFSAAARHLAANGYRSDRASSPADRFDLDDRRSASIVDMTERLELMGLIGADVDHGAADEQLQYDDLVDAGEPARPDDDVDPSQAAADVPACDQREQPAAAPVVTQGLRSLGVPTMPVLRPIPDHIRLPGDVQPVRFVRARDCRTLRPKPWIVKEFLLDKDVSVTFGPSGAMKSFLMFELAFCIAAGVPYCGKYPVREGYACYGYTEALEGSHQRIDALIRKYKLDDAPEKLLIWPDKVELTGEAGVGPLIGGIHQFVPDKPRIVVIDTLSANFGGGDENGPDMATAVRQVTMIREEFGCHANCVHHTGKVVGMKERGHSSLGANTDARIEVSRDEKTGVVSVRNLKTKDRKTGSEWAYRPTVHTLWTEHDDVMGDDVISSVTLDPVDLSDIVGEYSRQGDDEYMRRTVKCLRVIATQPMGSTDWRRTARIDNNKWTKQLEAMSVTGGLVTRPPGGKGLWSVTEKGTLYLDQWGPKVKD